MAHESFENDERRPAHERRRSSAIKVDREERPDVDAVYMTATQAMTGQGGWPMTVFATPDGTPFFCGTYFPRANFIRLLQSVATAWQDAARRRPAPGRRGGRGDRRRAGRRRPVDAAHRRAARRRGRPARQGVRRHERRVRRRAEVPAAHEPALPAAPPPAHRRGDATWRSSGTRRGDGPRRHLRPARRRLRALLGRRSLDRAALREDAVRQRAAAAGLHAPVAADRRPAGAARRRRDRRVPGPRPRHPGGRLRLGAGRGHRRRRGADLRVDAGPADRGARRRRRRRARPTCSR